MGDVRRNRESRNRFAFRHVGVAKDAISGSFICESGC